MRPDQVQIHKSRERKKSARCDEISRSKENRMRELRIPPPLYFLRTVPPRFPSPPGASALMHRDGTSFIFGNLYPPQPRVAADLRNPSGSLRCRRARPPMQQSLINRPGKAPSTGPIRPSERLERPAARVRPIAWHLACRHVADAHASRHGVPAIASRVSGPHGRLRRARALPVRGRGGPHADDATSGRFITAEAGTTCAWGADIHDAGAVAGITGSGDAAADPLRAIAP